MAQTRHVATACAPRQLAHYFGQIADTTQWEHANWQSLFAHLLCAGKAPADLRLGDVLCAIKRVENASAPSKVPLQERPS